jgi:FdhE protein
VDAGFLGRWLRRSPLPDVAAAENDLARLARDRPTLGQPAAVLADVLPWLFVGSVRESPPALTAEHAASKLDGGMPLLRCEKLDVDPVTFRRRWRGIGIALQRHQQGDAPRALAKALRADGLVAGELAREVLAGRPEAVHARAVALGLDPALTATVLRWTLFPVFVHIRAALDPFLATTRWGRGYCPVCGSWPLLGEFRGLEQTRFLRCGLCAAVWEFPHLGCPFCGERDYRQLGYVHVEGEEGKERAATCDACKGYVKMVSSLSALGVPQLLVVDLATMHLDLATTERGFFVG